MEFGAAEVTVPLTVFVNATEEHANTQTVLVALICVDFPSCLWKKLITLKIPSVIACSTLYCYLSIFRLGFGMGTTWFYLVGAGDASG